MCTMQDYYLLHGRGPCQIDLLVLYEIKLMKNNNGISHHHLCL